MAKNIFATIGILAVLLMGLGMVSATVDNVTLAVSGSGTFSNPVSGLNKTTHEVIFTINQSNMTFANMIVNFSGNTEFLEIPAQKNDLKFNLTNLYEFKLNITMPDETKEGYRELTANFYNDSGNLIGSEKLRIYYNSTKPSTANDDTSSELTWCEQDFNGEQGDLEIASIDIINNGEGDDDVWQYLDEIEIEITLENTNEDDSIDDIILEIEIRDSLSNNYNTYGKKDFDLNDDNEDVGRVKKDGGEETVTFTISELPIDLEEGTYYLYVRAYEDNNEDEQCVSESEDFTNDEETYFEFEVEASEDSTIIVKKNLENILASCGDENVEVTFTVYNTGSDDEDKVLVNLYNSALGIDEFKVIDNLKDGKGKEVTFFISVPSDASKNAYTLDIYTFYEYDDDEDEMDEFSYDSDSEDDGGDFSVDLEILSCTAPAPTINANLESIAEIGTDLVIKAIITNNGEDNDFIISASNFESWADLVSVNPQTSSINEGEFTEAIITLSPKVAGTQSFKINTVVDGESYAQSVSVNIAEKPGLFSGTSEIVTYTIIGIIAILVLIFLVLIAKISRRPVKPQF